MMNLLELDRVRKLDSDRRPVLDGLSVWLDPGELVVVWGARLTGRSTLLRVAAGIEAPDSGTARFDGHDLASRGEALLGSSIGFFRRDFLTDRGSTVVEQLISGQLARRVPASTAVPQAWRALERVDCSRCANTKVHSLKTEEVVRIGIARLLTGKLRLLVVDEPVLGIDPVRRDGILRLLRSIADDGVTVLATTDEGPGLLGADRTLILEDGRLDGHLRPRAADIRDLTLHRQARHG
jgi:ABC-type multidrug transport system ATPase subunit